MYCTNPSIRYQPAQMADGSQANRGSQPARPLDGGTLAGNPQGWPLSSLSSYESEGDLAALSASRSKPHGTEALGSLCHFICISCGKRMVPPSSCDR